MRFLFLCFLLFVHTKARATDLDVPPAARTFSADINYTGFSYEDEEKVRKAIQIIKRVVASTEFRDRVLNFSYDGKTGFWQNRGYSNAQIYQMILDGKETLLPVVDNEMDLDLELYYEDINTIGYTYPNVNKIWMNTRYFYKFTPVQVADNIFHEWIHKIGFDHDLEYSVSRDYSVPYGLGYLVKELGKKYE